VLSQLGRSLDRGEAVVERAMSAGHHDPAELLALQAGIYQHSEAVELTAKLVDHVASGLRTTLQSSG
jgi:hypothetical protein